MLKHYSWIIGSLLALSGIAVMFWQPIRLPLSQGIIHFVFGFVGVVAAIRSFSSLYTKWLGVVAVILAALAFAGVTNIFGIWTFDIIWKWSYLALGLLSVWVYLSTKPKQNKNEISLN